MKRAACSVHVHMQTTRKIIKCKRDSFALSPLSLFHSHNGSSPRVFGPHISSSSFLNHLPFAFDLCLCNNVRSFYSYSLSFYFDSIIIIIMICYYYCYYSFVWWWFAVCLLSLIFSRFFPVCWRIFAFIHVWVCVRMNTYNIYIFALLNYLIGHVCQSLIIIWSSSFGVVKCKKRENLNGRWCVYGIISFQFFRPFSPLVNFQKQQNVKKNKNRRNVFPIWALKMSHWHHSFVHIPNRTEKKYNKTRS